MSVDKLVDSSQLDADILSVANAIRAKSGTNGSLAFPSGFVSTVNALPQMTGELAYLGKDAELFHGGFYEKVDYLKNTNFHGWDPSTTAKTCVSSVTLSSNKINVTSLDQYAYYFFWECGADIVYTGSPVNTARPLFSRGLIIQELIRRPGSFANIGTLTMDAQANQSVYSSTYLRYYNDKSSLTYTWPASYGIYFGATAPAIASTTANDTAITPKTPTMSARCSTTYMSTGNAELIDEDNSIWWIKGVAVYRAKRNTLFDGIYKYVCGMINAESPTVPEPEEE